MSLFWLGNSQYANREYKDAIKNFNNLLAKDPDHVRAPDAMLSVANCQLEMKDVKSARKTLDDLMKKYPQSESAAAAKERLSKLK
jgi:tol-pal system protein YbgF